MRSLTLCITPNINNIDFFKYKLSSQCTNKYIVSLTNNSLSFSICESSSMNDGMLEL